MQSLADFGVQNARDRFGVELDYSIESLALLDQLVDQARKSYLSTEISEETLTRTIQIWGAYAGETLRRNKGGVWRYNPSDTPDRQAYVVFGNRALHPFEQIRQKIVAENPGPQNAQPADEEIANSLPLGEKQTRKRNLSSWLMVAGGIVLLLLLALVLIPQIQRQNQANIEEQRAVEEARFSDYLSIYTSAFPGSLEGPVALSGKMLIVNFDTGKIADLHYLLPDDRRAAYPEEVSIVVQESCLLYGVPTLAPGNPGTRQVGCQLVVVDLKHRKTVARRTFMGEMMNPGSEIDPGGQAASGMDEKQMIAWLQSLCQD